MGLFSKVCRCQNLRQDGHLQGWATKLCLAYSFLKLHPNSCSEGAVSDQGSRWHQFRRETLQMTQARFKMSLRVLNTGSNQAKQNIHNLPECQDLHDMLSYPKINHASRTLGDSDLGFAVDTGVIAGWETGRKMAAVTLGGVSREAHPSP